MADVPPCDGAAPIADQRHAPGSPPSGATEGGSSGPQYLGPSCSSLHVAGQTLTGENPYIDGDVAHAGGIVVLLPRGTVVLAAVNDAARRFAVAFGHH